MCELFRCSVIIMPAQRKVEREKERKEALIFDIASQKKKRDNQYFKIMRFRGEKWRGDVKQILL